MCTTTQNDRGTYVTICNAKYGQISCEESNE